MLMHKRPRLVAYLPTPSCPPPRVAPASVWLAARFTRSLPSPYAALRATGLVVLVVIKTGVGGASAKQNRCAHKWRKVEP